MLVHCYLSVCLLFYFFAAPQLYYFFEIIYSDLLLLLRLRPASLCGFFLVVLFLICLCFSLRSGPPHADLRWQGPCAFCCFPPFLCHSHSLLACAACPFLVWLLAFPTPLWCACVSISGPGPRPIHPFLPAVSTFESIINSDRCVRSRGACAVPVVLASCGALARHQAFYANFRVGRVATPSLKSSISKAKKRDLPAP